MKMEKGALPLLSCVVVSLFLLYSFLSQRGKSGLVSVFFFMSLVFFLAMNNMFLPLLSLSVRFCHF